MAEIILDIGSGRSLHNIPRAEAMIKAVADMDSHNHRIIFKAQLFQSAPPNVPLDHDAFDHLYHYANSFGYEMTASVFDKDSLAFLLRYTIPFVKIACRPDLYWIIGEVLRRIPVYASFTPEWFTKTDHSLDPGYNFMSTRDTQMVCVPEYPAQKSSYPNWAMSISDHTVGWELFRDNDPFLIEKHLCPEREADNPDSGPFAVTVDELREVIC